MQSHCWYCGVSLDGGDIYEVLKKENPEKSERELLEMAAKYGWTKANGKRFSKAEIYENKIRCPKCHCVAPQNLR